MALFKSSNPSLKPDTFSNLVRTSDGNAMSIEGTINKIAFLGLIVFASALYTWNLFEATQEMSEIIPYVSGGFIGGFVLALLIIFNKPMAKYLAPIYALLEGLALGALSAIMEFQFPGVVLQALLLTFGILFSLLFIYRLKIIKVTENFKLIVASATMGIALVYLVSWIGSFFGFEIAMIHSSGTWGIVFSLVVIVIAAMNLIMDFDFIEQGAKSNAPKYMEWYAAFGLMVTLVWLYIEVLRLLAKLNSRD